MLTFVKKDKMGCINKYRMQTWVPLKFFLFEYFQLSNSNDGAPFHYIANTQ